MDIKALVEQLSALTKRFNAKQKATIIAALIGVIALIAFLIVFASPRNYDDGYRALFRDLSAKDAGLVVQQLETQDVKFKIPEEGVIAVPKEQVNRVRLNLASQGLPRDGRPGFELFDTQDFGATDFDQQVKLLRALEGELSSTIESLESVRSAKVHIAMPKESVFVSKEIPPTASVVVAMKDGMQTSRQQILGVKHLVASAVPKLTVENVRIVNEDGIPLGEEDALTTAGETARAQLRYKRDYEQVYENKIVQMLAQFLGGSEKAVARVTIDFDFSQRNSVQEVFDPNNVPRSEQSMEYKREGTRPREIGGVPGAVSNIGPVQGLEDDRLRDKEQRSENTINYEISKKTSEIKGEFATINRVTAAVAVDGRYKTPKGDGAGDGELEYVPLTSEELAAIENLVKQAIGFNPERKDEVTVSAFEFRAGITPTSSAPLKWLEKYFDPIYPALKYLLAAILLFVFYKKVIKPFIDRMMEIPIAEEEPPKHIEFEEDEEEEDSDRANELKKRIEQQLGAGAGADEEKLKYDVLLERLRTACDEKPKDVATLIGSLLNDEISRASRNAKEKL
ncbi:MAG: flagellar M-ring protein FliF [Helicobacteraceae bacterium]|nr:flagellar M-ring protein FliF [Helicobacteraceae bacterium]